MTKILLAGDTHGNLQHVRNVYAHACRLDADLIFQLGDFGYGWQWTQFKGTGGKVECKFSGQVSKLAQETGIPLYWLPGNHENYIGIEDMLATTIPEQDDTYQHAQGVYYAPRGTVLTWNGKKILVCGGAVSVDRRFRTPFISWWYQESITDQDVDICTSRGPVDIMLSHDFPWECNIADRHLDPYWGEQAQRDSSHNRRQVSAILANSQAKELYHGHLHVAYEEDILAPHPVHVRGLDRDGTPVSDSTHLLEV